MGLCGSTRRWYGNRDEELRLIQEAKGTARFRRIEPADALRAARQQSGLSIEALANALGLYPAAVACWLSGRKATPWWVVRRLQRFAHAA